MPTLSTTGLRGHVETLKATETDTGAISVTLNFPEGRWDVQQIAVGESADNNSASQIGVLSHRNVGATVSSYVASWGKTAATSTYFVEVFVPKTPVIIEVNDYLLFQNVDLSTSSGTAMEFIINAVRLR